MSSEAAWLNVKGAAARVLLSPATIMRAARSGRLKGYKVGGRKLWRFRPADVDAWLESENTPQPFTPRPAKGFDCPKCGSTEVREWYRSGDSAGLTCTACRYVFVTVRA